MEQLCLGLSPLEGGEGLTEVLDAPFHDDFRFPIELSFAGLAGGFEEQCCFLAVEGEADRRAVAVLIGFVERVGGVAFGCKRIGGAGAGGPVCMEMRAGLVCGWSGCLHGVVG